MARDDRIGYKKILEGKIAILSQHDNETAEAKDPIDRSDNDKKTIENNRLNDKAYEDLLLSIDGETKTGKVAFNLVDNAVTSANPEGDSKIAWDRLINKYAPKTAPSYI
jgi:hypothetical protein